VLDISRVRSTSDSGCKFDRKGRLLCGAQKPDLLDHLVGEGEQLIWHMMNSRRFIDGPVDRRPYPNTSLRLGGRCLCTTAIVVVGLPLGGSCSSAELPVDCLLVGAPGFDPGRLQQSAAPVYKTEPHASAGAVQRIRAIFSSSRAENGRSGWI
jgi:hypothetical protein